MQISSMAAPKFGIYKKPQKPEQAEPLQKDTQPPAGKPKDCGCGGGCKCPKCSCPKK